MMNQSFNLQMIGVVRSALTELADAPRQGDEGGFEAWLEIDTAFAPAMSGIAVGDEVMILTWLHLADRTTLQVHPRGNLDRPMTGVFTTRSPHRPNPIGLHRVTVLEIDGTKLKVALLEALDGTPIIDIKAVLGSIDER